MTKKDNLKGSLILCTAALLWGFAFVVQDRAADKIPPFTFNCLRSIIGAAFLFCFMGPRSPSDRRATLRIYTPSLYRHGGLLSSFISQYSQMTNRKQGRPRKYMIFCRFFKLQEIMQFGDAQMCK